MAKFLEIQEEIIKKYNITLCYGEHCKNDWQRTHVHVKQKRICKWYPKNSIQSTFTLLHEIGHIMTHRSTYRRCEEEYFATVWALKVAREEYNLVIPDTIIEEYNDYIRMEHDRGVRRGGNLPSIEKLTLK